MSLTLKRYQAAALDVLARFFDLARGASSEAALDAAFRQTLIEQELPAEAIPPYLSQGFDATPYVCLRIPTGGGRCVFAMLFKLENGPNVPQQIDAAIR